MNYAKIKHFDIANGEGVRISLFVSGCQFYCKNCFNMEAWDYTYGNPYTVETENEIMEYIKSDNIDGLSILGGDPLWQNDDGIDELISLVKAVKSAGKNVWIWSGFTLEEINRTGGKRYELIKLCDVFVDGVFQEEKKNLLLHWRGSSNQRVIDVQKSVRENRVVIYCED